MARVGYEPLGASAGSKQTVQSSRLRVFKAVDVVLEFMF